MKERKSITRVFINNIDDYSSKYVAKFLSECAAGAHDETEEDESMSTNSKENVFELVGTVSEASEENVPYVNEKYFQLNREELLPKLIDCDVIVYNINQHQDQVGDALWAVTALHNELDNFTRPKMFILLSTVMTWACKKHIDPEDEKRPFTDEDFRRRRPHSNFKAQNDLEKVVVKLGKTNKSMLSTYVVVSGIQYGMGEQTFHYFFKMAWEGLKPHIPLFGNGKNIIPTIHINDLASVIQKVIEQRPTPYYLLAVDTSTNTLEEIIQAISKALGPGTVQKMPIMDAYLVREFTINEIDYMSVNLRMLAIHLRDQMPIPWQCKKGLVEHIDQVVEEYKQIRGLQSIRICVIGPPAVGKSTLSKLICDHYKLHHVILKTTVAETLAQLEKVVSDDPSLENESTPEAQERLNELIESMEQNEGLLEENLLLKVVRDKLMSKPCLNQGFVLDGFPQTYEQAKDLYALEEEEEDGDKVNKQILPAFVFLLEACDLFLKERVMNLPESHVEALNYEPDHFLRRLSQYRQRNNKDATVADVYSGFDIDTLTFEIASDKDGDCSLLLKKVIETVGPPRNYDRTNEQLEEDVRKEMEKKQRREMQRKAEEEERESEEARERAAHWEEWCMSLETQQRQEEELLEVHTSQMRSYLMEHLMPTLSQGLLACCSARPDDPLDFLAEYLMKNNPSNCNL